MIRRAGIVSCDLEVMEYLIKVHLTPLSVTLPAYLIFTKSFKHFLITTLVVCYSFYVIVNNFDQ